ncbi:hypothetical protein MLC59_08900 [Marinobacter bryozoorum]|uniref:hypothetical protein n=1 Tax=Marinobacter bryozoorum TaxID=256324 RepID=UPI0020038F85|nr:hypothetical protein [Marinobacter bryozoorum]MCK7544285.1 hypothetical protein [Marinobacter bryozoorum]
MAAPQGRITADSRRRFRGLVAFSVLGIAAWFLLDAVEQTQYRAEQQMARLMLNQVRSALVVRGAEAMLARQGSLKELEGLNPLPLLDVGEGQSFDNECETSATDKRGWCFNQDRGWLVYRPGQPLTLEGRQREQGEPFIWQVQVNYAGTVKQGKNNKKRATGLKLTEIDAHQVSETQ